MDVNNAQTLSVVKFVVPAFFSTLLITVNLAKSDAQHAIFKEIASVAPLDFISMAQNVWCAKLKSKVALSVPLQIPAFNA
jgi:hypothetical protein